MKIINSVPVKLFPLIFGLLFCIRLTAQDIPDTLNGRNIYNPDRFRSGDTIVKQDEQKFQGLVNRDSLEARQKFIRDSIEAREKFVLDSIQLRQQFVKDSIQRRKRILDSLTFLQRVLPQLFDASLKTVSDNIIVNPSDIKIVGDSTLTNYTVTVLPFGLNQPFTPWKSTVNLSDNPVKINIDTIAHRVSFIKLPSYSCSFVYGRQNNVLRINEQSVILNNRSGSFYKEPFDSVFFDRTGRITKIKRYVHLYRATADYQRGASLFNHLSQVRQFDYDAQNRMTGYQVVNFCDRWDAGEPEMKVCYIVNYSLEMKDKTYVLTRKNDPVNNYSDGTYTFEFDDNDNLKSVAFKNVSNSENWTTFVELNEDGNVNNYYYQTNGKIDHSLLFKYNLNDPKARYKVENITCTFESDGISYYQKNNTTGKSRVRNKMTLEWSPWK